MTIIITKSKDLLGLDVVEYVVFWGAVTPLAVAGLALPLLQVVSGRVEAYLYLHGFGLVEGELSGHLLLFQSGIPLSCGLRHLALYGFALLLAHLQLRKSALR